jgi:hypothetical protein
LANVDTLSHFNEDLSTNVPGFYIPKIVCR